MAASAADIKDPANENGRGALAMNVSRTIEVGRTPRALCWLVCRLWHWH